MTPMLYVRVFQEAIAVILSIENSRIIWMGLLNRKSKHFAKSVDSAFWNCENSENWAENQVSELL